MNKKKIKQAAKEFCDKKGIDHIVLEDKTVKWPDVYFSDFLHSMIETGEFVTKEKHAEIVDKMYNATLKSEDLLILAKHHSTVSSAVKEVNDEKTSKWILDEDCVRCNDIPLIEQSFPTKESRIAIKIASKAIEMKQLLEECIDIFVSNDDSDREFKNRIYNLLKEIQ